MMTAEQAALLSAALTGAHDGGADDVAVGACLQAADELRVLEAALVEGVSIYSIATSLGGVQARLRAAAALAGHIELARDAEDEPRQVRQ